MMNCQRKAVQEDHLVSHKNPEVEICRWAKLIQGKTINKNYAY